MIRLTKLTKPIETAKLVEAAKQDEPAQQAETAKPLGAENLADIAKP